MISYVDKVHKLLDLLVTIYWIVEVYVMLFTSNHFLSFYPCVKHIGNFRQTWWEKTAEGFYSGKKFTSSWPFRERPLTRRERNMSAVQGVHAISFKRGAWSIAEESNWGAPDFEKNTRSSGLMHAWQFSSRISCLYTASSIVETRVHRSSSTRVKNSINANEHITQLQKTFLVIDLGVWRIGLQITLY